MQELQKISFSSFGAKRYKKCPSLALTPCNTQHTLPEIWPKDLHQYPYLAVVPGHTKIFFRSDDLRTFAKYLSFSEYDPRSYTKYPSLALVSRYKNILP